MRQPIVFALIKAGDTSTTEQYFLEDLERHR